ncbi:MAG: hypothetical protein ACQEST_03850 [Bacteroidota bacterium]
MFYQASMHLFGKSPLLVLFWLALLFAVSFSHSYGQEVKKTDSDIRYWAEGGSAITTLGVGIQTGVVIDYNNHVFSLGATSTDLDFGTEVWDIAVLYGRSMRYQSLYLSAGTGVAVVGGVGYSDLFGNGTENSIETSLGFPLKGQISWEPIRFLALGIYSFANINTEQPFGGIGVSVRVGKFQEL